MSGKKQSTYHLAVKTALIVAGLVLSNHEFLLRLHYMIQFGHYFPLLVFSGIWAITLLSILYVSFTPNRGARTAWVILIGISTLLGETWFRLNGDQLSVIDLDEIFERLALAAVSEIDNPDAGGLTLPELFSSGLMMAFLSTGLLVSGLLMQVQPVKRLSNPLLSLMPLVPLGLLIALVFYSGATNGDETQGMPSQFHSVALITAYAMSGNPPMEKADVEIPQAGPPAARHIVLIVDESVAGDFIDLNVPRQTTPFLASGESGAINFGLAVSASNCSNASNAMLRLGANPSTLGLPGHSIIQNPSIWKYAAAAGFETTYINAQTERNRKRHYINPVELALIDHLPVVSQSAPTHLHDSQALEYLLEALSREKPQFVYVNKRGTYTPYNHSYPETGEIFTPALQRGDNISDRETLINTYKNSIRWSVDHFLQKLYRENGASDFVIIYTSDHGQNLQDDGRPTTHCRRRKQTLFEAIVPLLIWTDIESLHHRFERAALQNMNSASHFQIFPSLLLMMGYDLNGIRERYYETLFDTVESPPGFTTGPVMGRFGARPEWNSGKDLDELER